tara:strand:- start:10016 stop:10912 length:897 start_codon:yes stop_codon:yes gene_type:complete
MALTDKQMTARQQSVGGSDVPAILGISPFKSAADVFIEKTQKMKQIDNTAIEAGHMLEPAVIDWAIKRVKKEEFTWSSVNVRRTKTIVSSEGLEIAAHANLDFMFIAEPHGRQVIEAKTTGLSKYWGTEGTDEVPDYVLVQCLWQAIVADIHMVHVAVLIGDRGFQLKVFVIDPKDYEEEIEEIVSRVGKFWQKNVMEGVAPEETHPNIETLKNIVRTPNKSKELKDINVQSWITSKQELADARKREAILRSLVLSELDDAEEGKSSLGTLTYYEYIRKPYSVGEKSYRQIKWLPRKD